MQLTPTQTLIQEALLARTQVRAKQIQENPPENQPNLLLLVTGIASIHSTNGDGSHQANDLLVEACAYLALQDAAMREMAAELAELKQPEEVTCDA